MSSLVNYLFLFFYFLFYYCIYLFVYLLFIYFSIYFKMETRNFLNTKIISDVTYDTAIAPVMILVLLF